MNRRAAVDTARNAVRSTQAWLRAVAPGSPPDFLIIGGQRCGTTSLFNYLAAHPQAFPASRKEVQYFSIHYGRGERWYRGHFPAPMAGRQTFEASPYYLFHPRAAERVAATLPDAKFIALLRDPVERAYSHYLHTRSYGVEPLSFGDALAAEHDRLAWALRAGPDSRAAHTVLRRYSYAARGRYAEQLERWFRHVPRARTMVIRSEDFYADPASTYADVLRFLDLEPFLPPRFAQHTRRVEWGGPPRQVREALRAYFVPYNAALAELLGWPDPWPVRTP
ncbi:sulfotransferase [Actinomycetes bacterium KLBMP 9797]